MARLEVTLITGRTIDQGCGKERGKLSKEYGESVAICEINADDMKQLRIGDGSPVKVTTKSGSVVVTARKSRRLKSPGIVFMPYGAWANMVSASDTDGTGMPLFKGVKAIVKPTNETVLGLPDIIAKCYGKTGNPRKR